MKKATMRLGFLAIAGMLIFSVASNAQDQPAAAAKKFAAGQKVKISGQIVKVEMGSFLMRAAGGEEVLVKLTDATELKEKKINIFREAKSYTRAHLMRGLEVEVSGLGDDSGALAARDIKFTQTEYLVANSVESRVTPVEGRLQETEGRLTQSEENARHLSGQVEEVRELANTARGSAKAAQGTADSAVAGVATANERITAVDQAANARITAVDDFEVKSTADVRFAFGSAVLSPESKVRLDQVVKDALAQRGYFIEVAGFASADGNEEYNRILSQKRAHAVVQYLADSMVPLRRIVTPYGFGVKMPVGDNNTRSGREENRRVEVKILVSKGLAVTEAQEIVASKDQK
jgi:outer membrane protein OmpA-like peptidoglycan-associated protein